MSFWSQAWSWATGSSISSTIAKTALLGYGVKLLSDNINESSQGKNATVDQGVRLQLAPDTENKIPVLYGTAYFAGDITDANLSADYKTMTYCLTLAETTGSKLSGSSSSYQFNDVYLNNNRVVFNSDGVTVDYTVDRAGNQDVSFRNLVKIYFYANNSGIQPQGYSSTTPASSAVMPGWTSLTHPMTGLVYAIVQVTYNRDKGITGLPNCVFQVTNSMTLPGDVLYDYMSSTRYGAAIVTNDIDASSLTALNSFASAGFTYTAAGGQTVNSAITINGIIDANTVVLDNMEEMAKAAGCWLSYDIHKGQWRVIINQAGTAVATLDDSNILSEIAIGGTSLTQLSNVADVKYLNNDILDKPDFVKITLPENELFANEPRTALQLTLPFTNKQAVALKIGAQLLKQARVDKVITFSTDYSYINLTAGDLIAITSSVYGFTNKLFRIVTAEESQSDTGEIQVNFTALEYDADVYAFAVQEFEVETNDGILTIGSIGKPGVPQVSKIEEDSRPRIFVESLSPSGVVEGMEFWLSNDVSTPEASRVYRLIATRRPGDQGLYAEDTQVLAEYDSLNSSDFVVKTRGFNSQVFGPYSDASGFVEFRPTQVTQGISDGTKALGGLLGALTVLDLLKSVDGLLGGQAGKSIIDGVLETLFPNRLTTSTSVADLLLEDENYTSEFGGLINDLSNISIDELMDVDTSTISPNEGDTLVWDGNAWVPSSAGGGAGGSSAVYAYARLTLVDAETVSVDVSYGINTDVQYFIKETAAGFKSVKLDLTVAQSGPAYVVLATKGTNKDTRSTTKSFDIFNQTEKSFCVSLGNATQGDVIHIAVIGQGGLGPCSLLESSKYPSDRATFDDPLRDGPGDLHPFKDDPETIPIDHRPFILYNVSNVYTLVPGTGSIKLYRSNGVLDQELLPGGLLFEENKVTFQFANLDPGTDYYILMDKGVIKGTDVDGGTCYSPPITKPFFWNFHTVPKEKLPTVFKVPFKKPDLPEKSTASVVASPGFLPVPAKCLTLELLRYETQSKMKDSNNAKVDIQSNIKLHYNVDIKFSDAGQITIRRKNGTVWQAFNIAHTFAQNRTSELLWIENEKTLVINSTKDFEPNTEYYLQMTANCVYNFCGLKGNKQISNSSEITWKTDNGPVAPGAKTPIAGESINRNGLALPFDRPVTEGTGTLKVFDQNNNLVTEIPATDRAVKIN
jgi:hypothetical protein